LSDPTQQALWPVRFASRRAGGRVHGKGRDRKQGPI